MSTLGKSKKFKNDEDEEYEEGPPSPSKQEAKLFFKCDLCEHSTEGKGGMQKHYLNIHRMVTVLCGKCHFKAETSDEVQEHIFKVHFKGPVNKSGQRSRVYSCEMCHFKSSDKGSLQNHYLAQHQEVTVICPKCNTFRADTSDEVQEHVFKVHFKEPVNKSGQRSRVYSCEMCHFKNFDKRSLQNHYLAQHQEVTVICPKCNTFRAESQESVNQHIAKAHFIDPEDPRIPVYECHRCGFKTISKGSVENHYLSLHLEKIHFCKRCSSSFPSLDNLQNHMDTDHAGSRMQRIQQVQCDECHQKFQRPADLSKHKNSKHFRRNETTVDCPICGKSFTGATTLISHLDYVHGINASGNSHERTFGCDMCDYTSVHRVSIQKHVASIHRIVRFYCIFCEFFASEEADLNVHLKRNHPGKDRKKRLKRVHKCTECLNKIRCCRDFEDCNSNCLSGGKTAFVCFLCQNGIELPKKIKLEPDTLEAVGMKTFNCPENDCDFTTIHKSNLTSHCRKLHQLSFLVCNKCEFNCESNEEMEEHVEVAHRDTNQTKTPGKKNESIKQCHICEYQVQSSYSFKRHLAQSHGIGGKSLDLERTYACEECDHETKGKPSMETHYRVRHKVFPIIIYSYKRGTNVARQFCFPYSGLRL